MRREADLISALKQGDPGRENSRQDLAAPTFGTHRDEPKPIDYIMVSTRLNNKLISGSLKVERRGIFIASQPESTRYDTVTSESTAASDHAALFADFDLS